MIAESVELPLTPYAGTSGWSGSAASRDRAVNEDNDGTTSARQKEALCVWVCVYGCWSVWVCVFMCKEDLKVTRQ
jgi:hypothetical protein